VLIRGTERVRKSVRLEFVAGRRALRVARGDHELIARLAAHYSAAPRDLPAVLESQRAELKASVAGRRDSEDELARYRARELYDATAVDPGGLRRALLNDVPTLEQVRPLAQAFSALPRAVLVAVATTPRAVLIAASSDSGVDAGASLKAALVAAGGRGGGSPRLAQGTAADPAGLQKVVTALTASSPAPAHDGE
jgi:alanyl-tRNA synthetase